MQLKKWLNIWLDKYEKHTIKNRTYIKYLEIIEKHIVPKIGKEEIEIVDYHLLQDFVIDKLEHGNLLNREALSSNTVLLIVSVLKQSFKMACCLEIIKNNPMQFVKIPSKEEKEVKAFNRIEQQKLESFCFNCGKKNYIGIIICLYTGIRLGELLALTWDDIDFDKKILKINKTAYSLKGVIKIDKPKTKSSNRVIPLSEKILKILKEYYKISTAKYIICTNNDKMVSTRSYQRTFKSILQKCDLGYHNFHSLRHTFATRAIEMGMDVKMLSEILGHKNAIVTLERYSHSLFDYKIEMMNKLCSIMQNE